MSIIIITENQNPVRENIYKLTRFVNQTFDIISAAFILLTGDSNIGNCKLIKFSRELAAETRPEEN